MLSIIENSPLNYSILSELFKNKDDLQKAWPNALYPLNIKQWIEEFKDQEEKQTQSLFFKDERGNIVGHCALLEYKKLQKKLYLCYVILDPAYRGKGEIYKMLSVVEKYVKDHYPQQELYLNVAKSNLNAYHAYKKHGYIIESETEEKFVMKKPLH